MTGAMGAGNSPEVTTIEPGECVIVWMQSSPADPILSAWCGSVLAVDGCGIRLALQWSQDDTIRTPEDGVRVLPWARIDDVEIVDAARQRRAA